MMNRQIPDFCEVVAVTKAPWARVTKHLNHTQYPFDAGNVNFNMVPMDVPLPDYFKFDTIGQYRKTFTSNYLQVDGTVYAECWKIGFEIVEE